MGTWERKDGMVKAVRGERKMFSGGHVRGRWHSNNSNIKTLSLEKRGREEGPWRILGTTILHTKLPLRNEHKHNQ